MCPACLTSAAWLVLGGTSTGGLLTAGIAKLRRRTVNGAADAGRPTAAADAARAGPSRAPENS